MVYPTQILLVALGLAGLHSASASASASAISHCAQTSVNPADYTHFWLWGGVGLPASVQQVQGLYLYQGEFTRRGGALHWVKGGQPLARLQVPMLWLTVRLESLALSEAQLAALARLPERWARAGNPRVGLQIDFDAASYRLDRYATLLKQLRARLAPGYMLGVTGLLDWAQTGSVAQLNQLPIDEIVIQTYQGRHTIAAYASYLEALQGLTRPFRLGLVQGGDWQPCQQQRLAQNRWYRGEVIFIIKPDK